jgi:Type II CAAX prenyl endopeptidase Rce1-like
MNIVITLGIAAFALCLLWAVQSVALKAAGEPLAWPLRFTTRKSLVRLTSRAMIQVAWLIVLAGTPLALGIGPLAALRQAFPLPVPWRDIAIAFSIVFLPGCIGYALYIRAGWLRVEPKYDRATLRGKLFRRFLTPLPLATMEEAVFRGVVLRQLLLSLPQSHVYTGLAIVVSAAAFAVVHFIKPAGAHKSIAQGMYGYFTAGCLFGLAFVVGGHSLWLPITMHATAILVIEVMRLYTVHQAPPWLAGFSELPQSGVVGSVVVIGMAIALVALI